jgi:hypothetical protein
MAAVCTICSHFLRHARQQNHARQQKTGMTWVGFIRPLPRRREQVNKTFPTIRPIPFGTLRQNERMREHTVSNGVPVFLTLYPRPIGSDARPTTIRCPRTAHMDAPQNTGPHIDTPGAEQFAVRLFELDRLPQAMTRDLRIQTGNRI